MNKPCDGFPPGQRGQLLIMSISTPILTSDHEWNSWNYFIFVTHECTLVMGTETNTNPIPFIFLLRKLLLMHSWTIEFRMDGNDLTFNISCMPKMNLNDIYHGKVPVQKKEWCYTLALRLPGKRI